MKASDIQPGQRIRVRHAIDRREGDWTTQTEGVVLRVRPEQTGSWFAHGKDHKLWLLRVRLQKDDGEITTLNLDPLTEIELLPAQVTS